MTDSPSDRAFNFTQLWSQIEREAARGFIEKMSRREFLRTMSTGAALALFARMAAAQGEQTEAAEDTSGLPNGIASGDVTQTSAVLWARSATPGTVLFTIKAMSDLSDETRTLTVEATDPMQPVKVLVDDLTPGTPYTFEVSALGLSKGEVGQFTTAPPLGEKRGLRFGVSGDWRGELRPYVALGNVLERELAFFVALGDTIYADYPSEAVRLAQCETLDDFRLKHEEVYTSKHGHNLWREVRANVPLYAMIDDHEVTNDFAGGAAPSTMPETADDPAPRISETALYRNAMQAFTEYYPIAGTVWENTGEPRFDGKPKLYRYQTFGSDAAIILLDARSFRDEAVPELPTLSIFNDGARKSHVAQFWQPGRTMLGRAQVEQLKADLLKAQQDGVTWKFIMLPEPCQLTGWLGGFDRLEGYAPERTEILQFIEDSGIRNVWVVAADVHTTFISRLNYQTEADGPLISSSVVEVTTGAVAFWPPTGQAMVDGAAQFRLISADEVDAYRIGTLAEQDAVLERLYNRYVAELQGYSPLSLDGTDAELVQGTLACGHSFGWTEFDIDAGTQELTVTTYGLRAYDYTAVSTQTEDILSRKPEVLSVVRAMPVSPS